MTVQTSKPNERGSAAIASTAWALLAGWVLVRLVTTGGRARQPLARRRSPDARSESSERGQAKDSHVDPGTALADSAAGERGRHAESPTEIPVRGWKDILWRVYEEFNQDHVTSVAAGVTFFALLAIFPAIGALVSIYGLFADPATIRDHLNTLSGVLPGGAMEIIGEQVERIASAGEGTLGFAFLFGLAVSLWSANAGMKAIFEALNIVYEEEEKRSFIRLNATSLAFTLGAILFLLFALAAVVVLPIMFDFVGLGRATEWIIAIARWPILLVGVVVALALHLSLRPEPRQSAMAVDYAGEHPGGGLVDRRVDVVLLVRVELRIVQRDLWIAGRGHRLHDLDLDFHDHRARRRGDQRRDRASDRQGHDRGEPAAARAAWREDG